jgi:predicted DNA-binding transcriptional regulator AlpA
LGWAGLQGRECGAVGRQFQAFAGNGRATAQVNALLPAFVRRPASGNAFPAEFPAKFGRYRPILAPPLSNPLASPPQPGASREASMHPAEHQRLSGPEAAQYLGISASTLSKLRVFGGGPKFHKLGRRVVYDTRDLDGWFSARQRSSTSDSGGARPPARRNRRARDAVVPEVREAAAKR